MSTDPSDPDAAPVGALSHRLAAPAPSGSGPDPQTAAEKSVQFINAEVLDPPAQGDITFVGPFYQQTLVMALEDARSFVQGAEQILLIALAKVLEKYINPVGAQVNAADPKPALADAPAPASHTTPAPDAGLKAIESAMASLSSFHASMAETTHRFGRGQ